MIRFATIAILIFCSCEYQEQLPATKSTVIKSAQETAAVIQQSGKDSAISASRKNAITRAVEKASPAVVSITVTEVVEGRSTIKFDPFYGFFLEPSQREFNSMGSGFIISEDGLVVTNEHVTSKNAKRIVVAMSDGTTHDAEVLGVDELADLALLKISTEKRATFPYVEFSNSDQVMVGEWAIALGNPFGLFDAGEPSVTVGVVSATSRDFRPEPNDPRVYIDMIQTDAAINRGNSGGPLLNSNGNVIGVNTFIFSGGGNGSIGLGFAIPSNRVQKIITQLKTSGEVVLDYDPGMKFTEMTRALVYKYNLPSIQGLFVVEINKNGPAYEGGILPGDIILKIGDERVSSKMHAWALLREYEEGDTMNIELLRNNKRYKTSIILRKKARG